MRNKAKITKIVACLFLAVLLVTAVFGAIISAADGEGRTFTGDNAATNANQRLEIAKPLDKVPLTYMATVKMSSASAKGTIFGHWPGSGVNLGLNFEIYQGAPALCFNSSSDAMGSTLSVAFSRDSSAIDVNNTLAKLTNQWVTVAIVATPVEKEADTYDFDCYINGVKAYNTVRTFAYLRKTTIDTAQSVNRFAIGTNNKSNPEEFGGAIKNIALYSAPLTESAVKAYSDSAKSGVSVASKDNLIAHYDMHTVENPYFEEDLSGNGYHAYRSDKYKPDQTTGGKTFTVGDKVTLTNKLTTMPMTIEALFKTSGNGTVFGNNINTSTPCLNFEIFSDGSAPALCFPINDSGTRGAVQFKTPLTGITGYTKGEYNHIVITITPTGNANEYNFDCYINGVKAYATQTATAILDIDKIQEAHPFTIGSTAVANNVFNGTIKSVKLYSRALTATEIKYAAQSGATFSDILANYDMASDPISAQGQKVTDLSGNGYHAKAIYTGKAFTEDDKTTPYYVHSLLTEMPRSYAATIDSDVYRPGPIFSNYNNTSGNNTDFEIYNNGQPAYVYYTLNDDGKTSTVTSVKFNYDVRDKGKVHLVAVNEVDEEKGTSIYKLYANGELVDTVTKSDSTQKNVEIIHNFDMKVSQTGTRKFSIGADAKMYFDGTIYDVAVYSDAITAEEALDLYVNGIDASNESLIAAYGLNASLNADTIKDISGNGHDASKIDYTVDEGRTFSLEEALALEKKLEDAPLTISADVYLTASGVAANTIFGNYYARDYINFEITGGGRVALAINEMPQNKIETKGAAYIHSIIFNEVIPAGKWVNLTVTFDRYSTSADRYKLYIDGVETTKGYTYHNTHNDVDDNGNKTIAHNFELDMEWIQRAIPFTLGRDASKAFTGRIRNLALYSEPLTADEVMAAYKNGADLDRSDIIAYYDLTSPENTEGFIKDETENGYNFAHEFYVNDSGLTSEDYDYSFAFMGDIQFLTRKDSLEGTNTTAPIFNWLIQNKDAKKLQYVFGLGDVTDKNTPEEWVIASELFQSLGKAGIDYAVTPGNHDGTYDYVNYNTYFSSDPYMTNGIVYMTENNVNNYYKNFEVNGHKYMVMVLEFGAPNKNVLDKDVIQWANDKVSENSDRQVIVLTHGYIGYDGGFLSETELHCPPSGTNYNSGEEIWEKFVSQHSNIVISACGHIDPYNIKHRQDVGVNGNTVNQFLIDNQALDKTRNYDTGMIAMFYFSNGGKDVRVEYVSTTKSLREGKEIVFGKENQFNFTLDVPTVTENIKTPYGEVPFANSDLDINKVVLFGENKKFLGGFASVDGAIAELMKLDASADYTIFLRADARKSSNAVVLNDFTGKLTFDLGGNELKIDEAGNYLVDICYNDGVGRNASFEIKNGYLTKVHGRGIICMNYLKSFSKDSVTNFEFNNVHFRSLNSSYAANAIFNTWENGYSGATAKMIVNSTFVDCVFDMANSIDNAKMLNFSSTAGDRVVHNATVKGGEVIARSTDSFIAGFAAFDTRTEGRYDKLTFAANGKGEYLTITLPEGSEAPVVDYTTLELTPVSSTAGKDSYTFVPAPAPVEFVPKTSVTLYTDFKLNIYLPKDKLVALTCGGENVDLGKLDISNLGGVNYYKYSVSIKSYEAFDDVNIVVTVENGNETYNGSFIFSIYDYAANIIDGNYSEVEKNLVRDMLSYAKAACTYWNKISSKLDAVDALLGADYNSTADMTPANNAETPSGTGFTGVTLYLGDSPAYRFYYDETAEPIYTFTVDGKELTATEGKDSFGTYVEVKVYAYEMLKGVNFGRYSYSVYSYYNWAKTGGKTAEMTLVERLVNYCESANAYRDSIVSAN